MYVCQIEGNEVFEILKKKTMLCEDLINADLALSLDVKEIALQAAELL